MKKIIILSVFILLSIIFIQCNDDDDQTLQTEETEQVEEPTEPENNTPITVTDVDGNLYNTIKIGNQVWMLENLKTTKYNDGTPIVEFTFEEFGSNWGSLNNEIGHYRWADTSDLNNVVDEELTFDAYGAMYNHFAIESGKLAPEGWRIPTKADFKTLENFITTDGHAGNEATVLKTKTGWFQSSGNGTDVYGFKAVPNGYVSTVGTATLANGVCTWATSELTGVIVGSQTRTSIQLFDSGSILYSENAIQIGAGIRCIKE